MVILKDPPVFLLAGTEEYFKEEHLARIKSTFLDKNSQDFNFNIFYASCTSAEKILECACTQAFLGRKRVVLVRQIEEFTAADKKLILSYVKTPYKHTLLILETAQTNLYENFLAELSQYARTIFCQPLAENQLFSWLVAQVKIRHKRIEERALKLLVENLGNDLKLLSNSLDVLILYIGKKEMIEVGDIEKLVGPDLSTSAFELFNAIVARDKEKTFQLLESLFKDGINSSQILGALAHKVISERNRVEPVLEDLQKTDSDIKTGRQTPRIALELLMVRLLGLV